MSNIIIDVLEQAATMVRRDGTVKPIVTVVSPEGIYNLTCAPDVLLEADKSALQVISALLRWSMTRAFVVACEEKGPRRIGVYLVTAEQAEGFSVSIRKHSVHIRTLEAVTAPPRIQRLRALIPPPVATLSPAEALDLEEIFGMELDECQPYYIN
jgi:hypothetical protein